MALFRRNEGFDGISGRGGNEPAHRFLRILAVSEGFFLEPGSQADHKFNGLES